MAREGREHILTSLERRILILAVLIVLVLSVAGIIESRNRRQSECEIARQGRMDVRALAREMAEPLPVPSTGSLDVLNGVSTENARREAAAVAFLRAHPVPRCI